MVERRKSARSRCLLGARVVFNGRNATLSCTLRNYSEDGALLKFGETPYIPDQLEIVLDNRRTLMPIEVAWRRGDNVGIAFPRGRFLTELKEDTAKNAVASRSQYVDQTVH
jgi:PilZ domain